MGVEEARLPARRASRVFDGSDSGNAHAAAEKKNFRSINGSIVRGVEITPTAQLIHIKWPFNDDCLGAMNRLTGSTKMK